MTERAPGGRQSTRFDNESWVLGYVSAYNAFVLTVDEDVARGVDAKGLFLWVDNYCAAHPLDIVATAVDELIKELRRRGGWR